MKKLSAAANAGLILGLVIALYVGFRVPSLWSVNYYIPSIFDGFWRRSLLGTLLYPLGTLRFDYHFVAALQAVVLAVLLGLLVAHAWRSSPRIKVLTLLFLVGPAGGYLFHEVGYVEQFLYLMLIAALALDSRWPGVLLMALALLVHEMAAFTVIPLYLAALVVGDRTRTAILHGLLLLAVFVVIYLFFHTVDAAYVERLMQVIKAQGYSPRADYYAVFRHPLTGAAPGNYFVVADSYRLATAFALGAFAAAAFVWRGTLPALVVLGACLAPLVMGFFGWDTSRFTFLSISASFFVLVVFRHAASRAIIGGAAAVLLAFAVFGHFIYFDDYQPRPLMPYPRLIGFFATDLPAEIRKMPQQ
jgi:hypothetical protein